ncbi:MAG: hypothetical protein KZQ85_17270 [Candidatus Thiodiazotropha sp. (ex Myrtea sp. 'scaly one' KF741663)]|nr:hypothetical protein [Candidatus Thiodiazotropha sp. (ex Myrtea sp. 'scaly one' KF741663)]
MQAYLRQIVDLEPDTTLPYDEAITWIADKLKEQMDGFKCTPETRGIYLATLDSGAAASVAFWENALEQGPGFANPAHFPLTLANSSAAIISRLLNIQGPNYTLSGSSEALYAAFCQAIHDLSSIDESVEECLVLAIDISEKSRCVGMLMESGHSKSSLGMITEVTEFQEHDDPQPIESPTIVMSVFVYNCLEHREAFLQTGEGMICFANSG